MNIVVCMNDAMSKTVAMVTAAAQAMGYKVTVREDYRSATVFVDEDQSRFVGFSYAVSLGHVTVYENGRWQAYETRGVPMMKATAELDALRFRRAA